MTVAISDRPYAWWKEPTKDQWLAWFAGFLGWMLDARLHHLLSDYGAD